MRRGIALIALCAFAVRCASMVDGSTQKIGVNSDPAGAAIAVNCGSAPHHPKAATPTVLDLPRKADPCRITLTKDGYERKTIALHRDFSPRAMSNLNAAGVGLEMLDAGCCDDDWAVFSLFVTAAGALVGGVGLGFDRMTGAIYRHSPDSVDVTLDPQSDDAN